MDRTINPVELLKLTVTGTNCYSGATPTAAAFSGDFIEIDGK